MPRPIWKGAISFGLVTIPVNLYSAIERSEMLSFNLLHKKDHAASRTNVSAARKASRCHGVTS
jgi:DNA end-binding protein Ku